MAEVVLGVDGGGSGCRAALCDATGRVLGRGTGGPCNVTSDFDQACTSVGTALSGALAEAGLTPDRIAGGVLGLAGMRYPRQAEAMIARLGLRNCTVTDDRPTMIAGALGDADGAVVALGTGSFVGLVRGGVTGAVGGWGLQLSDQASAAWIGRAGLAATLEAVDGMQDKGAMAEAMLIRWGGDADAIVDFAGTARAVDYGVLAPIVTAAATCDPAAAAIMRRAARWIDRALVALGHDDTLPVVMTGGMGAAMQPWLARDGRVFRDPAGSALDGALLLARRATGLSAWG